MTEPPPPISHKKIPKTAKIVIAILLVACVTLASTTAILLSREYGGSPDVSGVQILSAEPHAELLPGTNMLPIYYVLKVYIILQIKNPTQYNVGLRLYGEANFTLSGGLSGNSMLDKTQDFSLPKYSQTDYTILIYVDNREFGDSTAVSSTINSFNVTELWRGIGSPP